jgi:hypothetical protein
MALYSILVDYLSLKEYMPEGLLLFVFLNGHNLHLQNATTCHQVQWLKRII